MDNEKRLYRGLSGVHFGAIVHSGGEIQLVSAHGTATVAVKIADRYRSGPSAGKKVLIELMMYEVAPAMANSMSLASRGSR